MAGLKCPNCGNEDKVVPIIYGVVNQELAVRAEKNEIRVGGYAVGRYNPDWACNNCGHTWS
jgi:hypothetical protein